MSRSKTLNIIISVLASVLLWIYVINVVNPPSTMTVKDIPVQLEGLENLEAGHLTIAGDGSYTVDVTLSASRAELAGISEKDIRATASLAGLSAGQNYINVNVKAPDSVTIDDIRSQKIQVYIDELVEVEKPLYIAHKDAPAGSEVTVLSRSHEAMKVIGADSLVKLVSQVRVDLDIDGMELGDEKTENLIAIPLDAEGNIVQAVRLESPSVEVGVAMHEVRTVPLRAGYVGAPGLGAVLKEASIPTQVNIKGQPDAVKAIESITSAVINIEGITADASYIIECTLPKGIYLAEGSENLRANFKVSQMGDISFSYSRDDLLVNGAPEGEPYMIDDVTVTVTASGELDTVRRIQATDLRPSIELTGMMNGYFDVPLRLSYSQEGVTLSVQPGTVRVLVGEAKEEPEENAGEDEGGEAQEGSGEGGEGESD